MTVLARYEAVHAADLLEGILATDSREQSGIWSTTSSVLAGYRTNAALESSRGPQLDPELLLNTQSTVYLAAPSEHQQQVAPLVAGLIRDLRNSAYRMARAGDEVSSRHVEVAAVDDQDRRLLLVLDELAGIAPLHDLPTLVAEGASQGVVTLACLQDLSQARERWGGAADGFLTLFGVKVVLPGIGDTKTLEALSLLSGEREIRRTSLTRPITMWGRRETTRTESVERVPRLPAAELAGMARGEAMVFMGTRPGRVSLAPGPAIRGWRVTAARSSARGEGTRWSLHR